MVASPELTPSVIERNSLSARLPALISEKIAKEKALASVESIVEALCQEARCDRETLPCVTKNCEERERILRQRRSLMETIIVAGDGLDIAVLKEQWNGRDVDSIAAELADMETETNSLAKETENAVLRLQDLGRDVADFTTSAGINAAVARRESAIAEIHESLRCYVEQMVAYDLLLAAMDQVRAEQQDPLVLRASQLLSVVTRGAFLTIETDIDGRGQPFVLGRRTSGESVHVSQMSDGTRDQLFLAFRIAAIEQYCRAAEPLPFIADDLLVHFDDDRSTATLDLLAELGSTTQVLLFTHHRRIVEAAQPLVAQGRAHVLELACD